MQKDEAISLSQAQNRIIFLDHSAKLIEELRDEADDWVEANDVVEFWGTEEDGGDWRVHVRLPEPRVDLASDQIGAPYERRTRA